LSFARSITVAAHGTALIPQMFDRYAYSAHLLVCYLTINLRSSNNRYRPISGHRDNRKVADSTIDIVILHN